MSLKMHGLQHDHVRLVPGLGFSAFRGQGAQLHDQPRGLPACWASGLVKHLASGHRQKAADCQKSIF